MTTQTLLCGHRGSGKTVSGNPFPENTLISIQRAIEEGAEMVEFDVLLSADGVPVLMHDDTVDRTTNGSGCVSAMTLAQLRDLRVGEGSDHRDVRIDTLAEVLAAVSIPLNVEVKVSGAPCPLQDRDAYARAVLDVLHADPVPKRRLLVSSFDPELLAAMRDQMHRRGTENIELGWLWEPLVSVYENEIDERDAHLIGRAKNAGFDAVHPHCGDVTRRFIAMATAAGLEVNTWTVSDEANMRRLLPMGLGAIITDEVATLARVMKTTRA